MHSIELPIFEAGNVRVTRTVAIIAGVSYPIAGITSVYVRRRGRRLIALGLGFAGIAALSTAVTTGHDFTAALVGVGAAAIGFCMRPILMIGTAGAEKMALAGSLRFLQDIRDAILQAVAERGRGAMAVAKARTRHPASPRVPRF